MRRAAPRSSPGFFVVRLASSRMARKDVPAKAVIRRQEFRPMGPLVGLNPAELGQNKMRRVAAGQEKDRRPTPAAQVSLPLPRVPGIHRSVRTLISWRFAGKQTRSRVLLCFLIIGKALVRVQPCPFLHPAMRVADPPRHPLRFSVQTSRFGLSRRTLEVARSSANGSSTWQIVSGSRLWSLAIR